MKQKTIVQSSASYACLWFLDRTKTSTSPEYDSVVDHFINTMSKTESPFPKEGKKREKLKDHLRTILANLHLAHRTDPALFIVFQLDSKAFTKDRQYRGFQLGYRNTKRVVDYLWNNGFITGTKGTTGTMSRMQATPKLIDLLETQHQASHTTIFRDTRYLESVRRKGKKLKDGNRKILTTPNTRKVQQVRENLRIINRAIMDSELGFLDVTQEEIEALNRKLSKDPSKYKKPVDFTRKTLYRVFVDGRIDQGGRFYGGFWQGIQESFRERMTINGAPVLELDYSGLHPHILYALKGLPLPDDPYQLGQEKPSKPMRKFLKNLLLVIINTKPAQGMKGGLNGAKSTLRWERKKAIKKAYRNNEPVPELSVPSLKDSVLDPIIQQLMERHQAISEYFYSDFGNTLQYIDSQIAEAVMVQFAQAGHACLPVHDSFIIDVRLADQCWKLMRQAFREGLGQEIPIDDSGETLIERSIQHLQREIEAGNRSPGDLKRLFDNVVGELNN